TEAEALEEYINAYTQDANAIEALVAQTVMRELLSYDIFPDTNETSLVLYESFGQRYRAGIEAMLDGVRAGVCPTDDEIDVALKQAPRPSFQRGPGYGGDAYGPEAMYGGGAYGGMYPGAGGGMGRRRSMRMMTPTDRRIADQICLGKAGGAGVYGSPADIAGYAYWNEWKFEDKDKAYRDCWYWQLGYWIIEDVIATVREMNANADSVLDAPVKRLTSVDFKMKRARVGRRGGMARRGARRTQRRSTDTENPVYATDTRDALTTPCTGRFTNEEIDVVQFETRLIVNVSQVVPFMQQLCAAKPHTFRGFYGKQPEQTFMHNQISVLESSVAPIDKESYLHDMYRYGDLPVVELVLLCEYVFDKTPAFEEIKPQQVKDDLAGEEEEK
ncbi:MAG: hypothetical protein ACYTAS_08380, partial [Planctomycetota bacterium]